MSASAKPTHAGGVVFRSRAGAPEFLLVTARRRPDLVAAARAAGGLSREDERYLGSLKL